MRPFVSLKTIRLLSDSYGMWSHCLREDPCTPNSDGESPCVHSGVRQGPIKCEMGSPKSESLLSLIWSTYLVWDGYSLK